MREYARVSPTFWTGDTGQAIRARGIEGSLMALYLMSAPLSNMLGLYYQPLLYAAHETGLGIEGASKGLIDCIDVGFCKYDERTQMVWVIEMAAWQIAEELKYLDKRCAGIQRDYLALPDNPFLGEWFDRYQHAFHLTKKRGIEAPSKQGTGKEQAQEQAQKAKEPPIDPQENFQLNGDGKKTKKTRTKREGMTFPAWIESLPEGVNAIPSTDSVFGYADKARIPRAYLRLAWIAFEAQMTERKTVQKDWPAHFRNAVKNDWFKLWRFNAAGECYLTTAGKQLEANSQEETA